MPHVGMTHGDDAIVVRLPVKNFWTLSKQYAEDHAKSEIYVLADDDQLIIGRDWVRLCAVIHRRRSWETW